MSSSRSGRSVLGALNENQNSPRLHQLKKGFNQQILSKRLVTKLSIPSSERSLRQAAAATANIETFSTYRLNHEDSADLNPDLPLDNDKLDPCKGEKLQGLAGEHLQAASMTSNGKDTLYARLMSSIPPFPKMGNDYQHPYLPYQDQQGRWYSQALGPNHTSTRKYRAFQLMRIHCPLKFFELVNDAFLHSQRNPKRDKWTEMYALWKGNPTISDMHLDRPEYLDSIFNPMEMMQFDPIDIQMAELLVNLKKRAHSKVQAYATSATTDQSKKYARFTDQNSNRFHNLSLSEQ